ncbi:glycerol kinase GlpK [Roseomonas xinghualingensis]|uniref:glycerol kinase GlpK n=1 Tax=Roseomonas xinghualingensis TaxID=2986475 RepID=UPI0021F0CAFB|nr:glycerol kinase GlpK [Roseomonas sp. SXEYE001]MCV4209017.1 glycerol kinase GlpK [Roseomonas sp. SXEYE001]
MTSEALLALDQGTTSTRAILFDAELQPRAMHQVELPQHFPAPGRVEHAAEDLIAHSIACLRGAMERGGVAAAELAGIGITNQRETTLVWERATGRAVQNAIVWQDRRSATICERLRAEGLEELLTERTGLLADPYFSATKLMWMLEEIPGLRERARRGELAFGTVDSFLLWRLTGGRVHATDATNAARTALYDIRRGEWDDDILRALDIPRALLPEVRDCTSEFGTTDPALLGAAIPIRGMAGDQQAATLGQACFAPGMVKSTYGTGCFMLLNTGDTPVRSSHRLLTTVAWQVGGARTYALEGAIFVAGAAVQWLRDGLGIIRHAAEAGELAARADPDSGVVMVPAFTGLGAPHWDAAARGAILGLTRGAGAPEICRAALESVAWQTRDLLAAMRADWPEMGSAVLRVDGGMTASDWTMRFLANALQCPVDVPAVAETTALGAAYLAGVQAGLCPPPGDNATHWRRRLRFEPDMPAEEAARRHGAWQEAVGRTRSR